MADLSLLLTLPLIFLSLQQAASSPSSSSSSAVHIDSQQLIDFKNTLKDPSLLPNWLPGQDPCAFTGISCKASRVASIELASLSLSTDFDSVSSHLLTLGFLESLSLTSADIGGALSFPSGSKCSAVLSSLDLSGNALSGPISDIANLGPCQNLKVLNFSGNSLNFSVQESAASGVKGLENLQVLDLSYNKFSGPNVNVSRVLSGGCDAMTRLSLRGNKLTGDVDVSSCRKLRYLDISMNNFSVSVPSLGKCSALEHLDVSSNRLSGDIGRAVSACSQLSFLNLSNNHFSGLIPSLPTKNLQFLYLSRNEFQGEIPPGLAELCPGLVELDLSQNNLSGVIPAGFSSCYALQFIDLSNNDFSGELPLNAFMKMSNVRMLVLSFNNFVGSLPGSFSNLTLLEMLDLSSNKLSGMIPDGLCRDPRNSLKELYLQNNGFTGPIPQTLSNCSQLVSLDLSFNYLKGVIPPSLGSLSKLQDLIILLNELNGEIPQELMHIRTLENLILDFNELTGAIPSGLCNCSNLNWISISDNHLNGEIPGWMGQLSNLAILKLSNNLFYGRIPPELGESRSLIWLDLNSNLLNGSIPPELFKESGNIELKLNNNKRYAYIENDGSKGCHGAGNLVEFAGIRPDQLNRLSTRNRCNFTRVYEDVIQPAFKNNGSMIFLDVSHNMLSGSIPKEIGSMFYLYILNLGHNNISGPIPPEIGYLQAVNFLDLSNNELEGGIPVTLSELSMLAEINLSNNRLTGSIPENGQFATFSASSFMNNTGLCGIPLTLCNSDPATSVSGNDKPCVGMPKFHLRKCSSRNSGWRLIPKWKLAISIFFGISGIALVLALIYFPWLKKKRTEPASSSKDDLSPNLSYRILLKATNGFSSNSLIGVGGFGSVYKGILDENGTVIAVKVLNLMLHGAAKSFLSECEALKSVRHRNLLKVLTVCSGIDYRGNEFKALVYEFMVNGSLEDWLHPRPSSANLDGNVQKLSLIQRINISVDVASVLDYLHNHLQSPVIHCDLKPSNVLLDVEMVGHVGDFGLAKVVIESTDDAKAEMSSAGLRGTIGYVAPEYGTESVVSREGDIYSYGILLLEMFTGMSPTNEMFKENLNLHNFVKEALPGRLLEITDPLLLQEMESHMGTGRADAARECLEMVYGIGVACSIEARKERMKIAEVTDQLHFIKDKLHAAGLLG